METKTLNLINCINNAVTSSPTGVTFFSIKNYISQNNETSNVLINLGVDYGRAKDKDVKRLTKTTYNEPILEEARQSVINSLVKPSETISDGQKDAYVNLIKGLKIHKETGQLYIWGFLRNKQVIAKGEYKVVKSKPLTLAKNEIKKQLSTSKFRQYIITPENVEIQGNKLIINLK